MVSDFQAEILHKLYAIKDNLGFNLIQTSKRMRILPTRVREITDCLPIDVGVERVNDIFMDSQEVEDLFAKGYLEHIPEQSDMFFRLGIKGLSFCE